MSRAFIIILFSAISLGVKAQDDMEYLMEVGVGVGTTSYVGDFNGSILKNIQPSASALVRRVLNPHSALRLTGTYGKLKGSSTNVSTYYPDYADEVYEFNNSLIDVSFTYEYNFWPYGTGRDYRGAKRLTPFIFGGLGGTFVSGGEKNAATLNVPIGLGVKYKIGERINLGVEWGMHFALSDKLDGVTDPYGIKSSGVFKNTDGYGTLMVTLTYSFMAKCKTCNKDYR